MKAPHYTEIKVRRWRLWPKVRIWFMFDMYAWFLIFSEFGVNLEDLKDQAGKHILYTAALSAARSQGRRIWFTPERLERLLETAATRDTNRLVLTMRQSQTVIQDFADKVSSGTPLKKK